jgi:putative membrane protein
MSEPTEKGILVRSALSLQEIQVIRNTILAALLALGMTSAAGAQDSPLTDAQVAHIAYTAGQIDITAAEQALAKSTNPAVLEFANQMARDHKTVNDQALALVEKLGVTPEDNTTSQSLSEAAEAKQAELDALEGAAYDAAYVANEIAYHQTVNEALKTTLIPAADDAELKALLETGLVLFTEHQTHAEHLSTTVQ